MEAQNKCFQTQINGFELRISLEGQTLKVAMISRQQRQSGNKFQGDLEYQAQTQGFKLHFQNMQEAFEYIKEALLTNNGMIRVIPQGKIQIGIKANSRIKYLALELQQIELQQISRLIQTMKFMQKHLQVLKINVQELKTNSDQKTANMLKMRQQLNSQIASLKQQLLDVVNLRPNTQVNDQKINNLHEQVLEKLGANKNQLNQSINLVKIELTNLLLKQSTAREEKVNEVNSRIQEMKSQISQIKRFSELQLVNHVQLERQVKQLGSNSEIQLAKQTAIQSKVLEETAKIQNTNRVLSLQFPKLMGQRFFPLTVNTNTSQFQNGYFKIGEDRRFKRASDNSWRQVVSIQQLPRKGFYYFQVMCHNSLSYNIMVGIITQSLKQNQTSFSNKQGIFFYMNDGSIKENGSSRSSGGKGLTNNKGLVTVTINADQKKIRWYIDHHLQGSSTISQRIMDKKIFACVQEYNATSIHQFRS